MSRRAALIGAAFALVTASAGIAVAAPSPTGVTKSEKRVCALPSAGHFACNAHVVTNAKTAKPLASTTWTSGYGADTLQAVYKPGTEAVTVAVVDAYKSPNAVADLTEYRRVMGLGVPNLTQYNQSGVQDGPAPADVGWGQEEMLDLEMVSAICPQCPIIYVGANSASFTDLAAAVNTARAKGAKVISNSYGAPEFSQETSPTYLNAYNTAGAIMTVSSGDSGYGVQFPAAAPGVIAVGGTSLTTNSDKTRKNETVWNGAGSGCSAYITKPAWQPSTLTKCSRRMVTDVSAIGDPNTGVAVYDSYGSSGGQNWMVFGGTSVAAPIVGAIYGSYGITSGSLSEAANLWDANKRLALFDPTTGSNGRCVRGKTGAALWCTGAVGYDGPTGNGTPNGSSTPF